MVTESLAARFEQLVSGELLAVCSLPREMPRRGIYLFSENEIPLYVGRTNRLRKRLKDHCARSSDRNKATFALKLALEATGNKTARYSNQSSRTILLGVPEVQAAFLAAKSRVGTMKVRIVEEVDPVSQCLLEVYAAVVLSTPYNDFDNH